MIFTSTKSDEISATLERIAKQKLSSKDQPIYHPLPPFEGRKNVRHLLVTDDERDLAAFLCGELGAKLLLKDVATGGEPNVADDPLSALPSALPSAATCGSKEVHSLIFWLADVGPVKTLGQLNWRNTLALFRPTGCRELNSEAFSPH